MQNVPIQTTCFIAQFIVFKLRQFNPPINLLSVHVAIHIIAAE
jgi:hypothetical protein